MPAPHARSTRLLFGHQSVGADLLRGVKEIRDEQGRGPAVVGHEEIDRAPPGNVIVDATVGVNKDPASKMESCLKILEGGIASHVDAVMLKFCYIDVNARPTAEDLWHRYVEFAEHVRARFPSLALKHCTIPLRRLPAGPYALARRLLGHRHPESERNRAREWFNERLRERFAAAGSLFDLATLESTHADGSRCVQGRGAERTFGLAPELTHDGGHLNEFGRRRLAARFIEFLEHA